MLRFFGGEVFLSQIKYFIGKEFFVAVAYEFNQVQYLGDVPFSVVGTQVHEKVDTESFVGTNTSLSSAVKENIQRSHDEVWGDAIDDAEDFYQKQRADFYGLNYLSKMREIISFITRPHSVEVTIPMPGLAGIRRRLSTTT